MLGRLRTMTGPSRLVSGASAHGAAEAVAALRAALRASDVDAAQAVRWLRPRPPGERDLLSDLAVAEGLTSAVEQLSRFWSEARVALETVRPVDTNEAEVYERLELPGQTLPIVSLVRRESGESPWLVVCTNEAKDERFTLWLGVEAESLDEAAFAARPQSPGDLLMEGERGVLGHRREPWILHVRGLFEPEEWPEYMPGEGLKVLEVAAALDPRPGRRRGQMEWNMAAVGALCDQLGAQAAYALGTKRALHPRAIQAASQGLSAEAAQRFWVEIDQSDDYIFTRGLGLLGLPEIEAPRSVVRADVEPIVRWLASELLRANPGPTLGTELVMADQSALLVAGRRGPRRGRSYGRFGAYALAKSDPNLRKGSQTRMRVPT